MFDDETRRWVAAPGGLVPALKAGLSGRCATWYGHQPATATGEPVDETGTVRGPAESQPQIPSGFSVRPLRVTDTTRQSALDGFCNQTLWPTLHGVGEHAIWDDTWWQSYASLASTNATVLAKDIPLRASVWVHDYHHFLTVGKLATLRPDLDVRVFIHTPIDPSLGDLPCADALLESLRFARWIGTQTERDRDNLHELFRSRLAPSSLPLIAASPVGVDTMALQALAADRDVQLAAAQVKADRSGVLLVGVDRIDYTKGLIERFQALHRLLDAGRFQPDDISMVQLAIRSRSEVPAYRDLQDRVFDKIRHINGAFVRSDRRPIVELRTCQHSAREVAALMRAGDIGVVNAARDGFNLVAAEFSVINRDRATALVLGGGAGIADHIGRASDTVDGSDPFSVAAALSASNQRLRAAPWEASIQSRLRGDLAGALTATRWVEDNLALLPRLRLASNRPTQQLPDETASIAMPFGAGQ